MTGGLLGALLFAALVVSAVAGPWVLRLAAPALVRIPRTAAGLLSGGILIWVLTVLALGPLLAWSISGPAMLPEGAAEVCQRCLAAANPFHTVPVDTIVPALLLLLLPALASTLLAAAIIGETRRRRLETKRTAQHLQDRAEPRRVLGHHVLVVDDTRPYALALPARHGGIVLSSGALQFLGGEELAAVLAHEQAHLRQRHHLVSTATASLSRYLRWVPLIAAAEDALGHYLEIAADDAARRHAGTTALAGALLTLGEHGHPARRDESLDGALHALGPDRIRHLVQPHTGRSGLLAAVIAATYLTTLALMAATVHLPYVITAITGCA